MLDNYKIYRIEVLFAKEKGRDVVIAARSIEDALVLCHELLSEKNYRYEIFSVSRPYEIDVVQSPSRI